LISKKEKRQCLQKTLIGCFTEMRKQRAEDSNAMLPLDLAPFEQESVLVRSVKPAMVYPHGPRNMASSAEVRWICYRVPGGHFKKYRSMQQTLPVQAPMDRPIMGAGIYPCAGGWENAA